MILKSVVAIAALKAALKRLGISTEISSDLSQSAIRQLGISATAEVLPILVAIQAGHFLTEIDVEGDAYIQDGIGAEDGFVYQFLKGFTDDTTAIDDAIFAFNKVINDNPSVSHTEVFDFYKSLANSANATDTHFANVGKTLTEPPVAVDVYTYALSRSLTDSAVATESDFKAVAKFFTENPTLADVNILSFFKNITDAPNFTDTINTLTLTKLLADTIGVTDDLDAEASILDDQVTQFVKNTTNTTTVAESFARVVAFLRSFSDNPGVTDTDTLEIGKVLSENPAFSDTNYSDFGKLLGETPGISEVFSLQVSLSPFSDAPGITDSADIVPNKVFTELPSLTDAGSLRSQGYCDFTFFAEDYVGASRNF